LEPSCLLTLRDEFHDLLPKDQSKPLAESALLLTEFLGSLAANGDFDLPFGDPIERHAVVHGHCHQKAFGTMPSMLEALRLIPDLNVSALNSGCCGMAGAFGYDASHYDVSMKMAEIALAEPLKQVNPDAVVVADGTSCRTQINDLTGRKAIHSAVLFERALEGVA